MWRDATDASVRAAAEASRFVRFRRGEQLMRRGRVAERLIVVVSGRVELRVRGVAGTVSTVAVLGEGECVGEAPLLTGEPSAAEVVAVDDVEALEMAAPDFVRIAGSDPELLRRILRVVAERLTRSDFATSLYHERIVRFEELLLESNHGETELVGKSPAMRKLRERVAELAGSDDPILVLGEDGTKRGVVARMVHANSPRRDGPLLAVDCSDITEETWGDRLFGSRSEGVVSGAAGFVEVAQGGTILLRDIERLPAGVQERLARMLEDQRSGGAGAARGTRVVATCGDDVDGAASGRAMLPALLAAFGDGRMHTPPLRERKRDIPDLATHLLKTHAARLGRPARAFDDQAMTRLVSYEYQFANDRELDAAVARAVILADGETVRADEIFFGPPPSARAPGIDLLRLPGLDLRRLVASIPRVGRVAAGVAFVAVVGACLLDSDGPIGRAATRIVWTLGWPALAVSFFFAARAACGVCPMGAAGAVASRVSASRRSIPGWMKDHGYQVSLAGFFLIALAEAGTSMRESPALTGALLVTILLGAVTTGMLLPRRSWCRHLCPLGGFAGVSATTSIVELRPSFDVCSARCTGHACFKGNDHVAGCPMFNHVMFVDGNQHCTLCMNCVRSCPSGSPRLNLRLPGRELWTGQAAGPEFGTAVLVFGGLTVAMAIVQAAERAPASAPGVWMHEQRLAFVTATLVVGAVVPLLAVWPVRRALARRADAVAASVFWRRVAAVSPLVTAGFVSYQLGYLPALPWLHAVVADDRGGGGTGTWAAFSVLSAVRIAILSAGLVTTSVVLWQVDRGARADAQPWRDRWRRDLALLGIIVGYWALLVVTMLSV